MTINTVIRFIWMSIEMSIVEVVWIVFFMAIWMVNIRVMWTIIVMHWCIMDNWSSMMGSMHVKGVLYERLNLWLALCLTFACEEQADCEGSFHL